MSRTLLRGALVVALVALGGTVPLGPAPGARAAEDGAGSTGAGAPTGDDATEVARELLAGSVAAAAEGPHVGEVTVVTFGLDGPRIATLSVRAGALGRLELRDGARWVLRSPGTTVLGGGGGAVVTVPSGTATPGGAATLDVERVLAGRDVVVGPASDLDTGPAVPVVLLRRVGARVSETLWVDRATGLLVRRETRGEDGRVLRVVAYTSLTPVGAAGAGRVVHPPQDSTPAFPWLRLPAAVGTVPVGPVAADDDDPLPVRLPGGFAEVDAGPDGSMDTVHYGDGLSMLSVYRQEGTLDVASLPGGASVLHVAGRDLWTWPGAEPLRLVWTGDGHTWTAVTDAPLPVVEDAVAALPGEMVAHDVPSRLLRGAERVRGWFAGLLTD